MIRGLGLAAAVAALWIAVDAGQIRAQAAEALPYTALAAIADTFVVQADTSANYVDLYEDNPSEGTIEHFSPTDMFTDTSVFWMERLRVADDTSDTLMRIAIHRGQSTVNLTNAFCPMLDGPDNTYSTPDDWALYLINVDDEQYVVWYANPTAGNGTCTSQTISFHVGNLGVVRQETGGDTVYEFVRGLVSSQIVVALSADNTYEPTFTNVPPPDPPDPATPTPHRDTRGGIVPSLPLAGERLLWILVAVGMTIWSAFKWRNGTVSLLLGTACCVIGVVRGGLDPIMLLMALLFGVSALSVYVVIDR